MPMRLGNWKFCELLSILSWFPEPAPGLQSSICWNKWGTKQSCMLQGNQ